MTTTFPDKKAYTLADLAKLGCCEVLVRVSSYSIEPGSRGPNASHRPTKWQAIVKHVNADSPWAVACRDDADEAERDARRLFVEMNSKPHKQASLAAQRAPKPPAKVAPAPAEEDDGMDLV